MTVRNPSALVFLLLALLPCLAHADTHDRWYVLRMQGQRAGWLHDQRTHPDDDTIRSASTIHLEIRRAEQTVTVSVESEFLESRDGTPLSMTVTQRLGSQPTTERYVFNADGVRVTSGDRISTRPLPDGKWLTPAAGARFIRQRLEAGADEITLRMIDPASGLDPVLYTNTVEERTSVEALGKTVPAIKWRVATDRHPGITTSEFVDEFGVPIRSESSMGGIKVEIILADRELALSPLDAPELLLSTLVKPDKPIPNPRRVTRATYRLAVPDAEMPDLPVASFQTVRAGEGGSVSVTVDTTAAPAPTPAPGPELLAASTLVTSDDAEVKRLAAQARGDAPADRAESLRALVHSHIRRKNLGVGFASASEVARTRTGDCTEHAVLLAAMLRAEKIPSRVVSGLIYAEEFEDATNVFGYHMWTQAYLDGAWRDLDATLPPGVPFDATHIALATSDLADGETTNALVSLVPLLGKLKIEVISTSP